MAAILGSPLLLPPSSLSTKRVESQKRLCISVSHRFPKLSLSKICHLPRKPLHFPTFLSFAAYEGTTETDEVEETESQESSSGVSDVETVGNDDGVVPAEEKPASIVRSHLQSYKEALANDDKSSVVEIENILSSMEDEKNSLENEMMALSQELSSEKSRILRISADFDNFRKRNERERLSIVTNVQGEIIENLLPVLDNFERAKAQIKVETPGEEKINDSYQSINKQFVEILSSLGVVSVETVGNPFDPLLHEAIMREESTEFDEGIIIQEFRKGFKLGDRLLRPSMVKVSAGPGPEKTEEAPPTDATEDNGKPNEKGGEHEEEAESA